MDRIHALIKSINISDIITSTTFKAGSVVGSGVGTFFKFHLRKDKFNLDFHFNDDCRIRLDYW